MSRRVSSEQDEADFVWNISDKSSFVESFVLEQLWALEGQSCHAVIGAAAVVVVVIVVVAVKVGFSKLRRKLPSWGVWSRHKAWFVLVCVRVSVWRGS